MEKRAIETRYGGCHFRSRLEARWAVFFDTAGIAWDYEPEGYDLQSGPYLPDFRIQPRVDLAPAWLEIKPRVFGNDRPKADPRWPELAAATGMVVMVARGMHRRGDTCGEQHTVLAYGPRGTTADVSVAWTGPEYAVAWDAASSARFEFGQQGAAR